MISLEIKLPPVRSALQDRCIGSAVELLLSSHLQRCSSSRKGVCVQAEGFLHQQRPGMAALTPQQQYINLGLTGFACSCAQLCVVRAQHAAIKSPCPSVASNT